MTTPHPGSLGIIQDPETKQMYRTHYPEIAEIYGYEIVEVERNSFGWVANPMLWGLPLPLFEYYGDINDKRRIV